MSSKIYDSPQAGLNAYQLMEELSALYSPGGWVTLRKTTASARAEDTRDYPPVYEVALRPNHMSEIDRELTDLLHKIADRWETKMSIDVARSDLGNHSAVFRFRSR